MKIISLGGSIINPGNLDTKYILEFKELILKFLSESDEKIIIITGGGALAREYQQALRECSISSHSSLDNIGIMATRLNAQLIKEVFTSLCRNPVIYNPEKEFKPLGKIIVAGGWKPGFSTDYISVKFAEKFNAKTVINLSNVEYIYESDPKKWSDAKPLKELKWNEFKNIVGDKWEPGKNVPFDPIATELASKLKIKLYFANGKDLKNLEKILKEESDFVGSKVE